MYETCNHGIPSDQLTLTTVLQNDHCVYSPLVVTDMHGPLDAAEWSWWTTSAHRMLASSQLALQRTDRALVNSVCQSYWAQRKVKLHITISLHPQPTEAVELIMKYGILYNISFWQDSSMCCTKSLHQELCPTLRQSTISLAHQCTNMASHFFHSCVLP